MSPPTMPASIPPQRLLRNQPLFGRHVLLRLDLDTPLQNGSPADISRLEAALPTIRYCLSHATQTLLLGHLGRPSGLDPALSLKPVQSTLEKALEQTISFVPDISRAGEWRSGNSPLGLLENLRFYPGEKENNSSFVDSLAQFGDIFVHDAFAVSHRINASGIGLPKKLPSLLGLLFEAELTALDPIINNPKRPITVILGGSKADKLQIVDNLLTQADHLLIGGSIATSVQPHSKIIAASLTPDGLDIDAQFTKLFQDYISHASTLLWNGPLGKYEDLHSFHGTYQIAESIAKASAYKVAGGGDTLAVIHKLNLQSHFNHLSTGGGALLYYFTHHSLPTLDAILGSPLP